jgi:hypothetical protein
MTKYGAKCPAPLLLLDSSGAVETVSDDVPQPPETLACNSV